MVNDTNGVPIRLGIDKGAWVRGDACAYRLEIVDSDGTCHLYNAGTCVDADGTTYCIWPMIRRTATIFDVKPGPFDCYDYGTIEDFARLLQYQADAALAESMLARIYGVYV